MSDFWDRGKKRPSDATPRWLTPGGAATQIEEARLAQEAEKEGTSIVELPKHLYPPMQAQTVNLIRAAIILPGSTVDLITFTPSKHGITGNNVVFTHYGIFNDGLNAANFSFQPLVNGLRVYPYHGSPVDLSGVETQAMVMALGMGPDLSDVSLVQGMLSLNPTDTLIWRVTNNDVVQVAMGVRHTGYVDLGSRRVEQRYGG